MNHFIVFEGLSATGKTTLARAVAHEMGATFYKTPPRKFEAVRHFIDLRANSLARFLFYLSGVCQASDEIKRRLRRHPVVCDRYVFTTFCFHEAIGVHTRRFWGTVASAIAIPDFTFLVTCDEKERLRRLAKRGLDCNDLRERGAGIERRFLKSYREYGVIEINNSGTTREALENVMRRLRRPH